MNSLWSVIRQNNAENHKVYYLNNKLLEKQIQNEIVAQFYLPYAELNFKSEDIGNDWISVGMTSVQGWRVNQEDAHFCDINFQNDQNNNEEQAAMFGVFDGHNGPEVALYAAEALPRLIKHHVDMERNNYAKALQESFMKFDSSLLDEIVNQKLYNIRQHYELVNNTQLKRRLSSSLIAMTTGTTAVVAIVTRYGRFCVANIGDSRCALCLKGEPYPLSKDHKPTDLKELKRIKKSGFTVINGRINQGLNLSRAFGDHSLKNNSNLNAEEQAVIALPDIVQVEKKIRAGDFMILACDGIWNCLSNKNACSIVRKCLKKNMKLSKICEELVRNCVSPVRPIYGQVGGDNMTCILVKFERDYS